MPVVDGIEATRRIRELVPGTRVVALAGSDDLEVVEQMLEAGASAYCVKGAPLWELERAIAGAGEPLVRLAHSLGRALPGGIGQLLARELVELTGALCAAAYLTSSDAGLSLAGIAGAPTRDRLTSAPGVALRAFTEAVAASADAHELAELYRLGVPCGHALAVPLVADGTRLGALLVAMPASVQLELDEQLVGAVADLAAASLAQERRLALTFAEARRDALTGLPNRRAFDEQLDRLLAEDGDDPVTVTLLDVDGFKTVNDTGGHAAGDEVLATLARIFLRAVRANEHVYRIGGDEFAVVLAGAAEAGVRAGERILQAARLQRRGRDLPTLSGGVAHSAGVESKQELLARADAALYQAKDAGGDKILAAGIVAPRKQRASAGQGTAAPIEVAVPGTRPLRILLVDDDPGLLVLLRTTFEIIDIDVEEAHSAAEAQKRIETSPPDVIVLDVAMPVTDGLFFCRSLKSDRGDARDPGDRPLRQRSNEEEAKKAGAEAFLRQAVQPARPARARRAGCRRPVRRAVHADGRRAAGGADPPLRPRSPPPARARARPALPAEEGLRGDDRRVRRRARGEGFRHRRALEASGSLRHGAHARARARAARRPEPRVRLPAPRRREDRDPGLDPPEARLADPRGAHGDAHAHRPRRAAPLRGAPAPGRGARRDPLAPRALGRERLPRPARRGRDPSRRPDLRRRGHARRDDERAPLPRRVRMGARRWTRSSLQSGRQFDPKVVGAFRSAEPKLRRIHSDLVAA